MTKEEIELANQVLKTVGNNTEFVIGQFANYVVTGAIVWIIVGIILIAAVPKVIPHNEDDSREERQWTTVFRAIFIGIGVLIIAGQIDDLLNPTARAIWDVLQVITRK